MKRLIFVIIYLFFSNYLFGQKKENHIEINPYFQWDTYPSFIAPFNSVTNSSIKLKGASWGIDAYYKHSLKTHLFIKAGLGYYKYAFNNIQNYTSPFGNSRARNINYTGGSSTFSYVCNKYWYNTVAATIGVDKSFNLKKNMDFIGGFDVVNYYTFSQNYNIPGTSSEINYKKTNNRYFGFAFNMSASLQKNFGKLIIGPTIGLPILRSWKQDMVFPGEQNNKSRNKWLKGIGVGITMSLRLAQRYS